MRGGSRNLSMLEESYAVRTCRGPIVKNMFLYVLQHISLQILIKICRFANKSQIILE